MIYLRVDWVHSRPEDPVALFSELDAQRWEARKVEVYRDGTCAWASEAETAGGATLGLEPVPDVTAIAADPQFRPREITAAEFEAVWSERRRGRERG